MYKNSLEEVVEDNHSEQRGSGELVGAPGVIEQVNAKRRRMNTPLKQTGKVPLPDFLIEMIHE